MAFISLFILSLILSHLHSQRTAEKPSSSTWQSLPSPIFSPPTIIGTPPSNRSVDTLHHPSKILYTYNRAVQGFLARLIVDQAAKIRHVRGVLSVIPDRPRYLHTTRTPRFLGLDDSFGIWPNSDYVDDVIVGVLDTGIWLERQSFSDEGFKPVPGKWKDILAVMDQVIEDGVDVISLSVGVDGYAPPYDYDSIAIGAFGAIEHSIVVSCSAGNFSPDPYTVVNIAPWILTVGASTLDQ
ncbi:unnamed protein product [Fraxinus pennsylvanica]|uniref:Uncharacterized protein n=1 Tax=Fraxinus pennsylvanica TaxID=56036 RepID=A0AAD2A9V0_9LAMI|nr:unnamed protein product [Fraxinus pennsylvanica]